MTLMIDSEQVQQDIGTALAEDLGSGDVTAALIPEDKRLSAEIISREAMLVCGQPWVDAVFRQLDPQIAIDWLVEEGQYLENPGSLCRIEGQARALLSAERCALNFLQTLSATATETYRCVQQLKGTGTRLLDTRKTLPGLRAAQKYAVRCGGGENHRFGLYDAYLIKENHIKACGSISAAISRARALRPDLLVEVEVESIAEFKEAIAAAADRIMLDNFTEIMLAEAVAIHQPKVCEIEISGGISFEQITSLALDGIDYLSLGCLTKSVRAIDLSLLVRSELI